MNRTIVSAFASIAGAKVLVLLVLAVTTPVLVRILGAGGYGEYATVMALFGLLMILVSSGINSGSRKYLAEERDDPEWKDYVFSYYLRIATVLALAASALLLAATQIGVVGRIFDPHYATYFYLLAVLALAAQFREYVRRSLMGLKLEHLSEPLRVFHNVCFGVVAIALAYAGFGVAGVLVGHIIASLLVVVFGIVLIARHVSLRTVLEPIPSEFPRKELRSFNNLSIVYTFLLTSLYHVDILMLDFFATSDQVGFYKAALVLAQFLWFVPKSVQSVMIQSTSDLWARGRIGEINSLSSKATRYTLLLSMLLGIGLAALAPDFVPIYYGEEFAPAVLPVLLLMPGTIGFAMARPLLAITHAKGAMNVMIAATGASAVVNVVLNLLLIPPFGTAGAAVATSVGYATLPLFHIVGARRVGYRPLSDVRAPRVIATGVVSAIGIFALARAIEQPLVALVVVPPVGFLLFSLLTIGTGAVERSEIARILKQLPGPTERTAAAIEQHGD